MYYVFIARKWNLKLLIAKKEAENMPKDNLEQIKEEIIKNVIPDIKKYEKQGKDKIFLQGVTVGMKISKNEKIA